MNKNNHSQDDISVKYLTASLYKSRRDENTQIRRQVSFTKGRIIVRGKLVSRGKAKKADFVLYYQHIPIALIEAKKSIFPPDTTCRRRWIMRRRCRCLSSFPVTAKGSFSTTTGLLVKGECDFGMNEFPTPEVLWSK